MFIFYIYKFFNIMKFLIFFKIKTKNKDDHCILKINICLKF